MISIGPSVYDQIGDDGFARLAGAFYRRVKTDDLLAPMYPGQDFGGAEERLRDFLLFRFGGPGHYVERRGHPRLRMRHAPFPVDQAARDRWVTLMTSALEETALPPKAAAELLTFFHQTATFMMNR